jgi:hypothetical protein
MESLATLVARACSARNRVVATLKGWNADQTRFKPDTETWSATEILEHLFLQEFSLTNRIWKAHEGWTRGEPVWTGEHTNRDRPVHELTREFTGRYQTPEWLTPKLGGPALFWIEALLSCDSRLRRLESLLENTDPETIVFPHFLLGPLDVKQWLDFLVFHHHRHREQIERLRRHARFPC